nr:hypothetical protein [Tanacetum cinerariifolium]
MDTCAALTRRVEHLEFNKVAQAIKITKLKQRVKKLERKNKERMIAKMDQDVDVVLEDDNEDDREIDLDHANKVLSIINITAAKAPVPAATLIAAPARVTAAPSRRRKGVVIRDLQEESTTSIIIPAETKSKDKGKGILVEEPKP